MSKLKSLLSGPANMGSDDEDEDKGSDVEVAPKPSAGKKSASVAEEGWKRS